jgi:hypothetical protein
LIVDQGWSIPGAAERSPVVRKIVHLRWKQRLGSGEIADRLDMASSTVHAVLVRCRINRLTHIDRVTGEPMRRYEHEHPGDLIHVYVKKLGKVPDGGGWRYVGRQQGGKHRAATAARTGAPKSQANGTACRQSTLDAAILKARFCADHGLAAEIAVIGAAKVSWLSGRPPIDEPARPRRGLRRLIYLSQLAIEGQWQS